MRYKGKLHISLKDLLFGEILSVSHKNNLMILNRHKIQYFVFVDS